MGIHTSAREKRSLSRRRLSRRKWCITRRLEKRRCHILDGNESKRQHNPQVNVGRFYSQLNDAENNHCIEERLNLEELNTQQQSNKEESEGLSESVGVVENSFIRSYSNDTDLDEASLNSLDSEDYCEMDMDRIQENQIKGRCIADISYILDELHAKFDNHNPDLHCLFRDLKLVKSRRIGLKIQMVFQCELCHTTASICTDRTEDETMDVNRCAVAGTISTGIGFSQMEELLASMDISCMAADTYRSYQMEMCAAFERAAASEMQKVAEDAKNRAIQEGDFIVYENEKIPFITVVADCSWMKRSYHTGRYDSLSGVGAILDYRTGRVLYRGVRNKFCAVCEWAARHNREPSKHVCFKNWGRDQPSTGMESDAIVEGFKQSVEINGLIYKTLIADGDSSVFKSILDTDPYGKYQIAVEKKECVNHLKRNLTKKWKEVSKTPGRKISHLKKLILNSVKKLRNALETAVAFRKKNVLDSSIAGIVGANALQNRTTNEIKQAALLKKDILNLPYHVFGDHQNCKALNGCCNGDPVEGEQNFVEDLKKAGLLQQIETSISYLSIHAGSLLYDATNNSAEAYNSIVCKHIGGKRINFGMRGSYQARCDGSVIQHNTQNILTKLHLSENKRPPVVITSLEIKRQRQICLNAVSKRKRQILRSSQPKTKDRRHGPDRNYGPNAQRPDLPQDLYDELVSLHNGRLLENQTNRNQIEMDTRAQADNALWQALRRKLLTASNFGKVCRMKSTTSCSGMVQAILFPSIKDTPGMLYGRTHEKIAINALEKKLAEEGHPVIIEQCGLFIDPALEYLGASPDGVIDNDGIVEIKCPISAEQYTPDRAIQLNVSQIPKFFDKKDLTKMNTSHHYYYQVQGQLHITQRLYCYFAVWTPTGLKYVKVMRNDEFWKSNMEQQLRRFYNHCLLPEIIDSRFIRKLPIRDPQHILQARLTADKKKQVGQISETEIRGNRKRAGTRTGSAHTRDVPSNMLDILTDTDTISSSVEGSRGVEKRPRIMPMKLIRSSDENNYWTAITSDDGSQCAGTQPRIMPLKIFKIRSKRGFSWSTSSSDARFCTSRTYAEKSSSNSLNETTDRAAAPWVIACDDHLTDSPTEMEIDILESVNMQVPIADIRRDILQHDSLLNDTSIDNFLDVVRRTSSFSAKTTLWLTHARFIKPLSGGRDIQIIGGNAFRHWRCIYFDGATLNIYDSLGCCTYDSLKSEEKRYIELRYPKLSVTDITFRNVQRQPDNFSCGVFAAAFATTTVLGGDPVIETYSNDAMKMRRHLLQIIESGQLSAFPHR